MSDGSGCFLVTAFMIDDGRCFFVKALMSHGSGCFCSNNVHE